MTNYNQYLLKILSTKGVNTSKIGEKDLSEFVADYDIESSIESIIHLQKQIMEKWKIRTRIINFQNLSVMIPNGKQNVPYDYSFGKDFFTKNNIVAFKFEDLEAAGLDFDIETLSLKGSLENHGTFKLKIFFKVEGESESTPYNEKSINFVVNPDPKSLWKNIPSNKDAVYWKEDDYSTSGKLDHDKSIVIASKRGRSHQNVGSFRDDHAEYKFFKEFGWTVVAVSDGAGSATLSRKGSEIACQAVVSSFEDSLNHGLFDTFEKNIKIFGEIKDEKALEDARKEGIGRAYKASLKAFYDIQETANKIFEVHPELRQGTKSNIDHFHATLIFTAFKKFDIGYVFLTFSVGDCPIGIVNKDKTKTKLLNWLDVGEFGGGTRFITQQEIFSSEERKMATRFNFHIQEDFSYLFLMTDGIYDPKFVVEANLEKHEKWTEFIADLKGENEDKVAVNFDDAPEKAEEALSTWMDFWSKGNHDDRTLAIVY